MEPEEKGFLSTPSYQLTPAQKGSSLSVTSTLVARGSASNASAYGSRDDATTSAAANFEREDVGEADGLPLLSQKIREKKQGIIKLQCL